MSSNWIQTFTGRKFFPIEPRVEDVCVEDIAHALALTCRFTGHCREFYSVAEHSCRVHDAVVAAASGSYAPAQGLVCSHVERFGALFHDAGEAYLVDVAKPIKAALYVHTPQQLFRFSEAENRILDAVSRALFPWSGLRPCYLEVVKRFDLVLLATEARDLMKVTSPWSLNVSPLADPIEPWSWQRAEGEFLNRWDAIHAMIMEAQGAQKAQGGDSRE